MLVCLALTCHKSKVNGPWLQSGMIPCSVLAGVLEETGGTGSSGDHGSW